MDTISLDTVESPRAEAHLGFVVPAVLVARSWVAEVLGEPCAGIVGARDRRTGRPVST